MKKDEGSERKIEQAYGLIFKKLREAKKFSRSEAAAGVMSANGLLKFENSISMPAFDKIFKMLSNINVSLLEYENACGHFSQKLDVTLRDASIANAYLTQDVEKLKSILSEIKGELEVFKNLKKYEIEKWHVEALINKLDPHYFVSPTNVFRLKDYLINLDEWGLYEIHLFGHCVDIFCAEDFGDLVTKMLSLTLNSIKLPEVEHAMIQTTLNIIDSCLSRKEFNYAKAFLNHLNKLKIHEYYMYEKFTLKYAEASQDYQTGKKTALDSMKKCREVALFCGCSATAGIIKEEITALELEAEEKSLEEYHNMYGL